MAFLSTAFLQPQCPTSRTLKGAGSCASSPLCLFVTVAIASQERAARLEAEAKAMRIEAEVKACSARKAAYRDKGAVNARLLAEISRDHMY